MVGQPEMPTVGETQTVTRNSSGTKKKGEKYTGGSGGGGRFGETAENNATGVWNRLRATAAPSVKLRGDRTGDLCTLGFCPFGSSDPLTGKAEAV